MSPLRLFARRELVCRQAVELLSDYIEGALSARDQRRLERHLVACPHCSEYLAQLRETIRAAGTIDVDAIDEATRDDLVDLYRRWRQE